MSPSNGTPGSSHVDEESAAQPSEGFKIPPLSSLLHFLWLKKWMTVIVWTLIAFPAGALLSIFDLPKSYTAVTVLRFPSVVGAQTNVMRDVAITQSESIIGIFNSFQVLEATIRKLNLRLRVTTAEVFEKNVFRSVHYADNLGVGEYTLLIGKYPSVSLVYRPEHGSSELTFFRGSLKDGDRLEVSGLELELNDSLARHSEGKAIKFYFSSLEEAAVDLRKSMGTRPLGSSFELKLKDRDPWLVSEILNTLRDQFLEVYYGTTEVQDVGILSQMEKDLELSKQKLERSQDELSSYYSAHPELMQQHAESQTGDNLVYLEARQDQDRAMQQLQRVQSAYKAKPGEASSDQTYFWVQELLQAMVEAGEPKASIERANLQEIQQKEAGLKATLAPDHPRIVEAESLKTNLYRQIEDTYRTLAQRLQQQSIELKQRMISSAPTRQASIPVKVQLELARLTTVNTNNQDIYQRLQESYNRAKLVTGSEFFKVTVVDPARPALYEPPSLKRRIIVAVGAMLALMLIVPALFLAWPILFRKTWTKEDMAALPGARLLGLLSWNPRGRLAAKKARKRKGSGEEDPEGAEASARRLPDPLLVFAGSAYTPADLETYRIIREEAESYFRRNGNGKYCLLMTSTRPNEGKTLTACNLAMTFARKGKRTLLIDADFRLGRVDKIFNTPAVTGLDELLAQTDMSDEQIMETATLCFQSTMQRNLVLAPRRQSNPNAGELVSSDRFKSFIRLAREQFDVVIIDTPPILITPEPLALAEIVDGVIFVCLSGGTVASEAAEGIRMLNERGVRVGAILNGVKASPFSQSLQKKYSYYYHTQPRPSEQGAE